MTHNILFYDIKIKFICLLKSREANVSSATVSYIINQVDNQTISEETRSRVIDIAKRLNYVPNLTARALVKGQTGLLGLLLMRNSNDGF